MLAAPSLVPPALPPSSVGWKYPWSLPALPGPQSTQTCQKDKVKERLGWVACLLQQELQSQLGWWECPVLSWASLLNTCLRVSSERLPLFKKPNFEANPHCRPAQIKERLAHCNVADPGPRPAPGGRGAWSCDCPTPAEHSHSGQTPRPVPYGMALMLQAGPFKHHNSLPTELPAPCNGDWAGFLPGLRPYFSAARLSTELLLPLLLQVSPRKPVLPANPEACWFTTENHESFPQTKALS